MVVATVDGVAITARRVAELAREADQSPREVVERLVDFELLAAEAYRRGLEDHQDVRYVTRQATAQRFLKEEFEAEHQPEDMPEDVLKAAFERNIGRFVRPRLRKVAHILVHAPNSEKSPGKIAAAKGLATRIAREAREVEDLDGFLDLGKAYNKREEFTIDAKVLSVPVYEKARLQRPFLDAALELDSPGEVGGPVETTFGSHVIYLIEVREPIDRSFEEARDEVRDQEHPHWMQREFQAMTEELRHSTVVTGFVGDRRRGKGP